MKTLSIADFKGGYNTDDPPEAVNGDELRTAENCYWKNGGLIQRGGHRPEYTTGFTETYGILGVSERYYINETWVTFIAIDLPGGVDGAKLYKQEESDNITALTAEDEDLSGSSFVYFAEMDEKVVVVNGEDKPLVIYYDGGWVVENLEEYDERTRSITTWNAGQYTDADTYTDDTTDAQDSDADDFQVASNTNNDGFFIACTHTFNKVILRSCQKFAGAPVAEYKYYATDSTWKSCSMVNSPTWTDDEGDRTIEFNYPSDMGRYDGSESVLANRFLLRVRFTTAPTAARSCDYTEIYHSQFLTQITGGTAPHYVLTHNNRVWLAVGYIIYFSPPNTVTGWRGDSESEYFLEGGPKIRSMMSFQESLVVFKDTALYVFYGTSLDSFLRKKVADVGIKASRAKAVAENGVYFLSNDGIRVWTGTECFRVSDHIKTDLDTFGTGWANGCFYDGRVWLSFGPDSTDDESIVLIFDPATLERIEETGEGRVAFFKFTDYPVHWFYACDGPNDNGYFIGAVYRRADAANVYSYLARLENGSSDQIRDGTESAIDFKTKTNYLFSGSYLFKKAYNLLKLLLGRDSSSNTTYTVTIERDEGDESKNASVAVASGSRPYLYETRLPYELDGHNLAIQVRNNTVQDAYFRGLTLQYERKEF